MILEGSQNNKSPKGGCKQTREIQFEAFGLYKFKRREKTNPESAGNRLWRK